MKNINLLILDDRIENVISLEALLKDIPDINIISTTDPNEALKLCWKNDISIALVDVQMPEINGFEFVSLLKSNPKTSHIAAIMVTAISKEDKYLIKGLESGAIDYLYKPLNPAITIAKVTTFVKHVRIQEEIIQKNAELEQSRIALIQANKEAEHARKSKEIFLANMSHEIRTPLNGILGIVHMLNSSNLSEEQRDWVNRLSSASNSLLMIINDILDISKIDSGMMKIEFEDFNLRDLIHETINIFNIKAQNKNINLQIDVDNRISALMYFDPLRLKQIISNFISNSLKFTEEGSIVLSVDLLEKKGDNYTIRFAVKDTGIGIKPEVVDKIFDAFEQGDDKITKKFGGTGLGLTIVKKLAELLNGSVTVDSVYGEGSTFSFIADIKEAKNQSIKQKEKIESYANFEKLSDFKVLVAEDNDLNSFMLSHMLKTWNCEVTIVKNGRQALNALECQDFDLILMDTHMPVMSGFEAIMKIRNHPDSQKRRISIFTVSASVMEHEQKAAIDVGADEVIAKPFDPADLYNKIVNIYKKRQ